MKDVTCLKDFRAASCCRSDSSGAMPGKAAQADSIIVPEYWCGGTASKGEGIVHCLILGRIIYCSYWIIYFCSQIDFVLYKCIWHVLVLDRFSQTKSNSCVPHWRLSFARYWGLFLWEGFFSLWITDRRLQECGEQQRTNKRATGLFC